MTISSPGGRGRSTRNSLAPSQQLIDLLGFAIEEVSCLPRQGSLLRTALETLGGTTAEPLYLHVFYYCALLVITVVSVVLIRKERSNHERRRSR